MKHIQLRTPNRLPRSRKTRLVLVGIGAKPFGPNPAGIVLSAALQADPRTHGSVSCSFLDFVIARDHLESMLWTILARAPDIVAFSVYGWNASVVQTLVEALTIADDRLVLIAGGAGVTLLKQSTLARLDYWTSGYADSALSEWLLDRDGAPSLDELLRTGFPYTERDDTYVSHFPDRRIICYDASRGCRFACSFCVEGDSARNELRRATHIIARELHVLAGYGYEYIDVADNCANGDPATFATYLSFAAAHPDVGLHLEARAELFSADSCSVLCKLPNVQVYMGLQSVVADELAARKVRKVSQVHRTKM